MILRKIWLRTILLALPVAVAGAVYANLQMAATAQAQAYICPFTGEQLRCEQCCPRNHAPCDQCDDGEARQ
jgi:cytochrome c-type biogenesis protein CcmH/NrfF